MAFVESGLRLLTINGKLGYVITSKVIESLYGGSMRKIVLEQYRILRLRDYSLSEVELFRDATNYPLILAIQKSPPGRNRVSVEVVAFGKTRSWKLDQSELPIAQGDSMSPWIMAPPEVITAFRRMQTISYETGFAKNRRIGDVYDVHMGVKTSANDLFLVSSVTRSATPNLMVCKTEGREEVVIEEALLRAVVRGGDIAEHSFKPSGYLIWTHDDTTGKVRPDIPENAKKYFESHKTKLMGREDYKKGMPIWTIFRVSSEKLGRKVGWQELDKKMTAVQLPIMYNDTVLGKRQLIPLQTVYFISEENTANAARIEKLLNSTPIRCFISSFAERARGGYFRHFSWTVGMIPVPPGLDKTGATSDDGDSFVALAYGLTQSQIHAMKKHYDFQLGG